jgi:hypothetical protein
MFRIFRPTSTIDIILSLRLSRKFFTGLLLFSLMLMMAFGFNGLDLCCKSLGEAVKLGCPLLDRPQCNQQLRLCFVAPPSVEALDVASMLLLGDFGSTISARDDRLVS